LLGVCWTSAADKTSASAGKAEKPKAASAKTYKVEAAVEFEAVLSSGSFSAVEGVSASQPLEFRQRLAGAEHPQFVDVHQEGGKPSAAEKKGSPAVSPFNFVVHIMPVASKKKGVVDAQFQLECIDAVYNAAIWQVQADIELKKGEKTVILGQPAKVEITISDAQ